MLSFFYLDEKNSPPFLASHIWIVPFQIMNTNTYSTFFILFYLAFFSLHEFELSLFFSFQNSGKLIASQIFFFARFFILFSHPHIGLYKCGNSMIYMMVSIFSHNFLVGIFLSHFMHLFSFICLVAHIFFLYIFFLPLLFCCIYGNEVLEQYKLVKFLFANDLSPIQWNWNG